MFTNPASEESFKRFLSAWRDNGSDVRTVFVEILRRFEERSALRFEFSAHDHAGHTLRVLHPDLSRSIVAIVEIPDDSDCPRTFAIRFYESMVRDPKEWGEWIPRGILGEDARNFIIESDRPALADYILERTERVLDSLPE